MVLPGDGSRPPGRGEQVAQLPRRDDHEGEIDDDHGNGEQGNGVHDDNTPG